MHVMLYLFKVCFSPESQGLLCLPPEWKGKGAITAYMVAFSLVLCCGGVTAKNSACFLCDLIHLPFS